MLVIERKPDQRIMIGEDIVITICRVEFDRVKVGIEAPADVRVDREEVKKARDWERRKGADYRKGPKP